MHQVVKRALSFGLLLAASGLAQADGGELHFRFVELKDGGVVRCALYASKDEYMKKSFREVVGKVEGKTASCVFSGVPPGTYALSAFHDQNNNGELDTGIFGIPKEGFAASNNAKASLGPAKYKDAAFQFTGAELKQELKMRYR